MLNLNLQWVLFHRSHQHSPWMRRCRSHEADNLRQNFSRSRSMDFDRLQSRLLACLFHSTSACCRIRPRSSSTVRSAHRARQIRRDLSGRPLEARPTSCTYRTAETAEARGTRGGHIKLRVGLWIELITTATPAHCLPRNLALRQCLQASLGRRVLMSFRKRP